MRNERFKVISVLDEAIDTESMPVTEMREYVEKRDINLVSKYYKPGMKPVVFHVRAVHHSMWEGFVMAGGDHEDIRYRRAFMCGVEKVDDLPSKDGLTIQWEPTRSVGLTKVMTDDECNERFAPSEVLEIGSVIFHHSFLPLRNRLTWELPSSCAEPLANHRFRSAAANPSTVETTINAEPSAPTAVTPGTASG